MNTHVKLVVNGRSSPQLIPKNWVFLEATAFIKDFAAGVNACDFKNWTPVYNATNSGFRLVTAL